MTLTEDQARLLLGTIVEHLERMEATEVLEGIQESRRLGIEESLPAETSQEKLGTVRRRPATNLEMLRIAIERLHERLVVLPALARSLRHHLKTDNLAWRVDTEFVSEERLPEVKLRSLFPDDQGEIATAFAAVVEIDPSLSPTTRMRSNHG